MSLHEFLESTAATRQQPTGLYQMSVYRLPPKSSTFSLYSNYQICCLKSSPLSSDQELLKFPGVAKFTPFPKPEILAHERLEGVKINRGVAFRPGAGRGQPGRPVIKYTISFRVQVIDLT
jgi:hypothetical protein